MTKFVPAALVAATLCVLSPGLADAATKIFLPPGGGPGGGNPPAADVFVGDDIGMVGTLDPSLPDTEVTFTFTAKEKLKITGMSLTLNGALTDIQSAAITTLPPIGAPISSTIAGADLNATRSVIYGSFLMSANDTVNLLVTLAAPPVVANLSTLRYQAVVVPLPAALPLALTALGGLALLRLRKPAA